MKPKTPRAASKVADALKNFDQYPDSAHVRVPVVAALRGCSEMTVWRHSRAGILPPLIKISDNITAMNVGELRKVLNKPALAA